MKTSDKIVWTMIAAELGLGIFCILRYFIVRHETEEKQRELEQMEEQYQVQETLRRNAELLDLKMREIRQQIEEGKKDDEFDKQCRRLIETTKRLLDEGS